MTAVNSNVTPKKSVKTPASSIENIKEDIYTLKADVIELGRTVKSEGMKKIEEATIELQDKIDNLKSEGRDEMDKVQSYINNNPNNAVGIAFAAGALVALLLRRGN
ncbi:MAG: hypothetical protein DI586_06325 [Micavibrio aeruginosavorus]|uniref:DUF883 domain-containing protein n=1 Tax=Micavibrio aeruginosavorus TaxID=349221 RepID=A0A2W5FP65_9BACT|nr:MAG: hypothetical protein DI586_06325 [Micavibrio aeruginosavorus]